MIDGNTYALREYEKRVMESERALEMFNDDIESDVLELYSIIKTIRRKQAYFEEFYNVDLEEEVNVILEGVL